MPATLRNQDSEPGDSSRGAVSFAAGPANASMVWSGVTAASIGSFETLERLSTFSSRAHSLTCCACGQDHSAELLAFKTAISGGVSEVGIRIVSESVQFAPDGSPEAATAIITGEVGGSVGTAGTLAVGNSVISQIEVSGDQDWYAIELVAGVTYEFTLNGSGGDALSDPFLEIMGSTGSSVASNDDGGVGLNSLLRYTPTRTGTFYVNAHGWIDANGGTSTGTYTLAAVEAPPLPTYTISQIADYLVNEGSSSGRHWAQTNITYNIEALTAAQQVLAERALAAWSAVTPLTFTRTTGTGNITFQNTDPSPDPADPNAPAAYAQTTYSGAGFITASTVVITSNWQTGDTAYDSYTQQTYIHEVGHALGLGHAGPYNGAADWGTDNIYTNDNWAYTVMSYFDQLESGFGSYRLVLGLQQADIVAIQSLYGARPSGTFAGNTTFGFNSSAPGTNIDWSQFVLVQAEGTYRRPPSMTIYDTSGTDTINLSGFSQPQVLNLAPGSFSSLGDRPIVGLVHYTNVVSIAADTTIENAIGGAGNDSITGNTAANTITGLLGNDTISGLGGDDRLNGGDGVDLIGISGNIYRLYTGTLGREPDVGSHQILISMIHSGAATFTQMVEYIISSPEFLARYGQPDNGQFVTLLYNNVLGRDPDPAGYNAWLNALNTGFSRVSLVSAFTDSPESVERTLIPSQSYAINSMHYDIEGAIFRLYQATLGRTPDPAGFTGWVNYIQTDQATYSSVILGFIGSAEFTNSYGGLNNTQFVTLLYNNVLGRQPDPDGLQGWVNYLNSGATRADVVTGFAESAENVSNTRASFINFMRSTDLGWQDTLYSGTGNDTLFGGRGTDTFVVNAAETGTKTVYGLQAYDYVHLQGFASLAQFTAGLTQQGLDAVYTSGGQSIRFVNAAVATVVSVLQLGAAAEVDDGSSSAQLAEGSTGTDAGIAVPESAEAGTDPFGLNLAGLELELALAERTDGVLIQAPFTLAEMSSIDAFDFARLGGAPEGGETSEPMAFVAAASLASTGPVASDPFVDALPDTFDLALVLDRHDLTGTAEWA